MSTISSRPFYVTTSAVVSGTNAVNLTVYGGISSNSLIVNTGNTVNLPSVNFNDAPITIIDAASGSVFKQIQNLYPGVSASTDISLYNDTGAAFLDIGINSSKYNGNQYSPTFNIVGPNDSYVFSTSGNLALGTSTPNNGDIVFFAGSTLSGATTTYSISSITVNDGGNYQSGTLTATINGGGGTGATANVVPSVGSIVTGFVMTNFGSGYTSAPTVTVTTSTPGVNRNGTFTANLAPMTNVGERMRITNGQGPYTGNIGIGTSTPNQLLTVAGTISASTAVYANGVLLGSGGGTIDTGVRALTSNWQSTYTTVCAYSASWGTGSTGTTSTSSSLLTSYVFTGNGSATSFNLKTTTPLTAAAGYILSYNGALQIPNVDYGIVYQTGTNYLSTYFIPPNNSTLSLIGYYSSTIPSTVNGNLNIAGNLNVTGNNQIGINTNSTSQFTTLNSNSKVIGLSGGTNQSTLALTPSGGDQGQTSDIALWSTFQATPGDNGVRRTADIIAGFNGGSWGNEYLTFNVGDNGASNDGAALTIERMRINGSGNVGIGTTAPSSKLTVVGDISASGTAYSNGSNVVKAWGIFDGTVTSGLLNGYQVTSVAKTATGVYTVTLSITLPTTNYAVIGTGSPNCILTVLSRTATTFVIHTVDTSGTAANYNPVSFVIYST